MKYLRFIYQSTVREGLSPDGDAIHILEGDIFSSFRPGPFLCRGKDIETWLPPTMPSKVVAVGLNYRDHALETGYPIPEEPLLFIKPSTCVIANGNSVILPEASKRVDYEAELAIVIGRISKDLSPEEVGEHVLGYSCFNDVTARDLQTSDGQWTRSKSFDTFGPYGPWVALDVDPSELPVKLLLNGKTVQNSNTREFIFPVPKLVSYISHMMTLLPGDVIITGTPAGIGPVSPGDTMEVAIEGIGSLINRIADA